MSIRDQAIAWCEAYCNRSFTDGGAVDLPPLVALAVDRLMQGWSNAPAGITSVQEQGAVVSGSDMGRVISEVEGYLRPYKKVKLVI